MEKEKLIKILKGCGWGALAIVLLFALVLAIASPVAKHVINNKGEQILGRQRSITKANKSSADNCMQTSWSSIPSGAE